MRVHNLLILQAVRVQYVKIRLVFHRLIPLVSIYAGNLDATIRGASRLFPVDQA